MRDPEVNCSWSGHEIIPLGGDRVRISDEDYALFPQIQTAFTDTR